MSARRKSDAPSEEQADNSREGSLPESAIHHHLQTLAPPMREWSSRAHVPPVLLLTGIAGVGKREMGRWLAAWILCETAGFNANREAACGTCRSCLQMSHGGDTVDFSEIRPDSEDGESGALKIERFRELKAQAGFSGRRVILIPNCDQMTMQAANSVLKLLEEPPRGWVILMTASDPTLILPTVLSRCQAIRLKPFDREELARLLSEQGAANDRLLVCAELAQGSYRRAIELSGEENWKQRTLLLDLLREPGSAATALVDWASQDDRHFELMINQLEHIAADLLRGCAARESGTTHRWLNTDAERSLDAHAARVSKALGGWAAARGFWSARAERLAQARSQARAPLNRKLLIQDILLPWLWA